MTDDPIALLPRGRRRAPALLLARRRRRARVVGPPLDHRLARRRRRLADLRRRRAARSPGTPAGAPTVVGDDVVRGARGRARRGRRTTSGSATSATPRRPDLPAATGRRPCPTRCGCGPRAVRMFEHEPTPPARPCVRDRSRGRARSGTTTPPTAYADAFAARPGAPARRQLLRGQPHLPARAGERPRPGDGVPPAARAQPRAVRRLPPARRRRARGRGCSAQSRSATPWSPPTGRSRPSRSRAPRRAARRRRRTSALRDRLATRPEVPRREPDDRRPAPQRPRRWSASRARSRCRR